jgi:hypothetical protein
VCNKKTPEEIRQSAQIDKILGWRENELAFSFAASFDSLHGGTRQIAASEFIWIAAGFYTLRRGAR